MRMFEENDRICSLHSETVRFDELVGFWISRL